MKKATTLDKEEMALARSLENEEWVSDLTDGLGQNRDGVDLFRVYDLQVL